MSKFLKFCMSCLYKGKGNCIKFSQMRNAVITQTKYKSIYNRNLIIILTKMADIKSNIC